MDIIARLNEIKASILKRAVQKQDVVDFYLMSLIPEEYLKKTELGPEHVNGQALFNTIIFVLRDEYVKRGLEELKDEAETTAWQKGIDDSDMPDEIKQYYTFHETGYSPYGDADDEDGDSDEEQCAGCGDYYDSSDLYYDDASGENYCDTCYADIRRENRHFKQRSRNESEKMYCKEDNKWVFPYPDREDVDEEGNLKDIRWHRDQGHTLIPKKEYEENRKKQLKLFPPEETPQNPPQAESSLTLKAAWWEAPENFSKYKAEDFYKIFKYAPWRHLYGGPAWAEIAKTIYDMEHTEDPKRLMLLIDHFHDLGHNTGKLLDKFPEWSKWFRNLLDEKASFDSIRRLIPAASSPVRKLVTEYLSTVRRENWRKPKFPQQGFSDIDMRVLLKDPTTPAQVIENILKYVANKGNLWEWASQIIAHPRVAPRTLKWIKKYLEGSGNIDHYLYREVTDRLKKKRVKSSSLKDKWPKQRNVIPYGYAAPGTLAYEPYKEGDKETKIYQYWQEAKRLFFQEGKLLSVVKNELKQQGASEEQLAEIQRQLQIYMKQYKIQLESKKHGISLNDAVTYFIQNPYHGKHIVQLDAINHEVVFEDDSFVTFDELVDLYLQHAQKKTSDYGFLDGPKDLGKDPEGDFPSVTWMPRGEEDEDVDADIITSSLKRRALEEVLTEDQQNQIAAEYGPEYNSAVLHYYDALKDGHPEERAFAYALNELKKVGYPLDPNKLVEVLETYFPERV